MKFVGDFTCFKIVRFPKKSYAPDALNVITEYITPAGLKISSIRTDEACESGGELQQVLDS